MTDKALSRLRASVLARRSSSDFDLNPEYRPPQARPLRPAAVLVPVLFENNTPKLLLTKRAAHLKHHPGQISFPGGKQDPEDADATATALREADEEIGLPPKNVEILGSLSQHETVTGFQVTPVVGLIHTPFRIRPQTDEVQEAFFVPLAHALDPAKFQIQHRLWQGQARKYFTLPYGPYYIWGATARILRAWSETYR